MKRAALAGVRISRGPSDWQIVQRKLDNTAEILLAGTWMDPSERMGTVEVRLVDEVWQRPVAGHLDWQDADTSPDHTWRLVLERIPAGGWYRVETRLKTSGDAWRLAGDHIHHIGVGDLWLVMGDDNAVGFGRGTVEDPVHSTLHMFRKNERWSLASHPIHDMTGIRNNRYFGSGAAAHSPWLAFGRLLQREIGLPIGLIPAAIEGSALEAWHSGKKSVPSPALDNAVAMMRAASSFYDFSNFSLLDGGPILQPRPEYPPGALAGCVWFQGNADCRREGAANNYEAHFASFVDTLRRELDSPLLPLVVCQLNRVIGVAKQGESRLWGLVREAQRAAGYNLVRVAVIPTLDSGLSDGIHNSSQGNVMIGERAARAALGLAYGKTQPWRAPDVKAAWFQDGERDKVVLEFSHVSGELRPVAGEVSALAVGDAGGGAPIRKVKIIASNRILATLNRELGEAPVISFCATHNPPLAFVDDNNCPPLAFANVAIQEDIEPL